MSIRTLATLAVAVILGLIAVVILNGYLNSSRKPRLAAAAGVPVVVAALPIARGVTLQPPLLKVVAYPAGSVPAGGFAAIGQLTNPQRSALRDLAPDEPILMSEVSGPGGRVTLSGVLDAGMQAVAVRSNDVSGVGGFVLPGDRVDVLLTRSATQGGDQQSSITQIVAENVRVLGVDQSDNDQSDHPTVARSVTIEVTPVQAQVIALGQSVGSVSLSLRHVADNEVLARRVTTLADLGFAAPVRPRPAGPPPPAHADAASEKPGEVPLYGPGIVRVTRVTETTGYRLSGF